MRIDSKQSWVSSIKNNHRKHWFSLSILKRIVKYGNFVQLLLLINFELAMTNQIWKIMIFVFIRRISISITHATVTKINPSKISQLISKGYFFQLIISVNVETVITHVPNLHYQINFYGPSELLCPNTGIYKMGKDENCLS